jgi:predicted metal-binding membrane protein
MLAVPLARRSGPPGRWTVGCALAALAALSWWGLVAVPMPMPGDAGIATVRYLALTFAMWLVMMVAMMTPSVAPTVLLFHRVEHQHRRQPRRFRTAAFVAGYFSAWAAFSLVATVLQAALIEAGGISAMGASTTQWTTFGLLAGAAVYQLLPIKQACLQQCRSPAEFIAGQFRGGTLGAWRMGALHGALCVGCCWALMLLLFVGGVMNLAWVGALTLVTLLEKLGPGGGAVRRLLSGALLVAAIGSFIANTLR